MKALKSKFAAIAFVVLAAAGMAPASNAALFAYLAPCVVGCTSIGIADGDNVAALFEVNDSAVAPNAIIDAGDMTAAVVFAGNLTFTLADFGLLAIALDATATSAVGWFMLAGNDAGAFAAFNDGTTNLFAAAPTDGAPALGGPGAIFRLVPEPTSLALLGAALLVTGFARRKASR